MLNKSSSSFWAARWMSLINRSSCDRLRAASSAISETSKSRRDRNGSHGCFSGGTGWGLRLRAYSSYDIMLGDRPDVGWNSTLISFSWFVVVWSGLDEGDTRRGGVAPSHRKSTSIGESVSEFMGGTLTPSRSDDSRMSIERNKNSW